MVNAISEIEETGDGIRPIIVQFQNGELQEGEEGKLYTGLFRKSENETVVALSTRNILYTGEINREENKNELHNRFLLISNRKTGKVRLVPVDSTIVIPQLKRKQLDTTDRSNIDPNASISKLNKEFGSKKIKRLTEQRERYQMNIDDVKEQLEQTVAGIDLNETETFAVENTENQSSYRPPINRDASTKENVYNLDEIVPEQVLSTLDEETNNILMSDLDEFDLSSFVKEKLRVLQTSSSDKVVEIARILLYVDYLVKFVLTPAKNITKRFVICHSSQEVNSHILENFSVSSNTGRSRPLSMRDKAICTILVLAMISSDYQLDMEEISKNVKVGLKKLQEIGRVLAFSSHSKNKTHMILKIPLPPPVTISPKKKRK